MQMRPPSSLTFAPARASFVVVAITSLVLASWNSASGSNMSSTTRDKIRIHKKTHLQKTNNSAPDDKGEFDAEKIAVLAQKRRALIQDIKRFIRDARPGDQAAELNLRLGNLYMEDYYANLAS